MAIFKRFRKNTDGNVAMMFGIASTLLLTGVAVAVDGSRVLSLKSNLQDISDAAALAGAYVAYTEPKTRIAAARASIEFHLAEIGSSVNVNDIVIKFDDATEMVTVELDVNQDLVLGAFLGEDTGRVKTSTTASYAVEDERPVSIAFVLDMSGSMNRSPGGEGGPKRITTLKQASNDLFAVIEDALPFGLSSQDLIRTGMNAYNRDLIEDFSVPMSRGVVRVRHEIADLTARGATNSTPAFAASYEALRDDAIQPEGLRQYIIFMTDGNNEKEEDGTRLIDAETIALCNQAKADGMSIFTVAFAAPPVGVALLEECASEPKSAHFFDADNGAEFRAAFEQIGASIGQLNTRLTR